MNKIPLILLGIILILHTFILTKLIYFPYPELFVYPYLTNHGLKPYGQIFDQHFPGLMFFPINLNNLGMTTPQIARVWSIVITILVQLMLFLIGSKLLKSQYKAILINILYLIWHPFFEGWVLWIDSFLPIMLLVAFYALYRRWIFLTGFLLGISIVFKQVLIPLSVIVFIYIFWESKKTKEVMQYLLGLFPPIILMLAYFFIQGTLKDFWFWTVIFNLTIFAKYGGKEIPSFAHLTRVLMVFTMGLLGLLHHDKKIVYTLLIFILGLLAGTFARFDFVHFQPALPFVLIFTILGFNTVLHQFKRKILAVMAIGFYTSITIWWLIIFYKGHISNNVLLFDDRIKKLAGKIEQYTNPKEKIFIFGEASHLYQISKTLPAGDVFAFQFAWFLMVAEDKMLEGLKKDQPEIIVANREADMEGQKIKDFARKLDKYILDNYLPIDRVGETYILRRKSS